MILQSPLFFNANPETFILLLRVAEGGGKFGKCNLEITQSFFAIKDKSLLVKKKKELH